MLQGTKRLFPTEYESFKDAMTSAAEEENLPIVLQLDDIKDFTLKDFQDAFYEFQMDTGLSIEGHMFICEDCGKLHVAVEVDYPEFEEDTLLQ